MIVSDAPNCGLLMIVIYNRNSFIIQATGWITLVRVSHFEVCSQNLGEIEKLADTNTYFVPSSVTKKKNRFMIERLVDFRRKRCDPLSPHRGFVLSDLLAGPRGKLTRLTGLTRH
jgi:hypothetical protein